MTDVFDVIVPTEFFDRCQETGEDQFWMDDRGFVYRISWSDEHGKPMAGCVGRPRGSVEDDIWFRHTPQPIHLTTNAV